MRVEELEDLLARLPGDLLVHVCSLGGAVHIDTATKRPQHTWRRVPDLPGAHPGPHPPSLILRGQTGWWNDEPAWGVTGRWPQAAGLPVNRPAPTETRVCPCCRGVGQVRRCWPDGAVDR